MEQIKGRFTSHIGMYLGGAYACSLKAYMMFGYSHCNTDELHSNILKYT
jgi:hypothetical protein